MKYRPYPEYRESDLEWLGQVPLHWELPPLRARYDVQLGKMLDSQRITGHHLVPYLRNVDVRWDSVETSGLPEMDIWPDEYKRYTLRSGDLLVCEGGEVGRTATWRADLELCGFQKAVHRLRPTDPTRDSPRFLYYLMRAAAEREVFVAGANPNTIPHLTAEMLRAYRLPFPPLDEQHAIAAFLDREAAQIDSLVAKKERLIGLLREKRTALITRAVTKGLDPSVLMKDSGVDWLGPIPVRWTLTPAMRLTALGRPIMYGIVLPGPNVQDGVPIVKGGDVAPGGLRRDSLDRTTFEIEAEYVRSRLRAGDIVYAIRGSIGAAEIVPYELEGANLTQDAARVSPAAAFNVVWLLFVLRSPPVFAQLEARATGATIRGINIRDLKRAYIPVPPKIEQDAIAAFLDCETAKIDALIAKVREAIERLKEYRTALVSAAVTGKIDVRGEAVDPAPLSG